MHYGHMHNRLYTQMASQHPSRPPSTAPPTSSSAQDVPGDPPTLMEKLTLGASSIFETYKPLKKICEHVCAFHLYAHDLSRQVEAHHYCSHLSSEVRQCVLYESGDPSARLIGVEYMISARMFEVGADVVLCIYRDTIFDTIFDTITHDRRCQRRKKYTGTVIVLKLSQDNCTRPTYLHLHNYRPCKAFWTMPCMERRGISGRWTEVTHCHLGLPWYWFMQHSFSIWALSNTPSPPTQLMMAATSEGQIAEAMLNARDAQEDNSTARHRKAREGLCYPPADSISKQADHVWHGEGNAWQVEMVLNERKN